MSAVAIEQLRPRARFNWTRSLGRLAIYTGLLVWTIIFLFPLYWTVTTSIKPKEAVIQGPKYVPWVDFQPNNAGWFPLLFERGTQDAFVRHFQNTLVVSVTAAAFAVALGSIAAYGLSRFQYRYGPYDNTQIRNFFLAQLILPPAAVALPILLMFINLGLKDTREGLVLMYTVMNLPDRHLDHVRPVQRDSDRARSGRPGGRSDSNGGRSCASCCRLPPQVWWRPIS